MTTADRRGRRRPAPRTRSPRPRRRAPGPTSSPGPTTGPGELAESGILAPINLGASTPNYNPAAISGFTFGGQALRPAVRGRERGAVPQHRRSCRRRRRRSTSCEQTALELKTAGTVDVPLAVQQDPADPYHNYPMFAATGGYVFGVNPDNTYNPQDLGLALTRGASRRARTSRSGPSRRPHLQRRLVRHHDPELLQREGAVRHHRAVGRHRHRDQGRRRR